MNALGRRFVVDTNALIRIRKTGRATKFFREYSVLPEFVYHEASDFSDWEDLEPLMLPISKQTLEFLKQVMATIEVSDTTLIDLYANLGNADPLVIAVALEARHNDNETLFGHDWYIVSSDKAVIATAKKFAIPTLSAEEFSSLIDESEKTTEH